MNCLAVPKKYRQIGDFHEYYSGTKRAPYLTIFVGGNHEASNHLTELFYGGWVAPNIYYMGAANVLRFGGLRIAGMSGIWKGYDYMVNHYERIPYKPGDERSIYHTRKLDTRKLMEIRTQVDIGISHDWPQGVEWMGDYEQLFKRKKFLEADANKNALGSNAARQVMQHLKPPYWFSAHLHIKYAAMVPHEMEDNSTMEHEDTEYLEEGTRDAIRNSLTRFLALDKCLPHTNFLQLLEVQSNVERHSESTEFNENGRPRLLYDPEWLAITRVFADTLTIGEPRRKVQFALSGPGEELKFKDYGEDIDKERKWVQENIVDAGKLAVPENFEIVAPVYSGTNTRPTTEEMPPEYDSPQMDAFCDLLKITNPLHSASPEDQEQGILGLPASANHARDVS